VAPQFIMIGSGNPQEGELRPQLLDRFGLSVNVSTLQDTDTRVELVMSRMQYEEASLVGDAMQNGALYRKLWSLL
jgi:magnesium chelatase subunit I